MYLNIDNDSTIDDNVMTIEIKCFYEDCVKDKMKDKKDNVKYVQDIINAKCHYLLEPASTYSIHTCIVTTKYDIANGEPS